MISRKASHPISKINFPRVCFFVSFPRRYRVDKLCGNIKRETVKGGLIGHLADLVFFFFFFNLRVSRPRSFVPMLEPAFEIARIITSGNLFPRELFENTVINVELSWKRFLSRPVWRSDRTSCRRGRDTRDQTRERVEDEKRKGKITSVHKSAAGFELRATQPFHSVLRRQGDENFCALSHFRVSRERL